MSVAEFQQNVTYSKLGHIEFSVSQNIILKNHFQDVQMKTQNKTKW